VREFDFWRIEEGSEEAEDLFNWARSFLESQYGEQYTPVCVPLSEDKVENILSTFDVAAIHPDEWIDGAESQFVHHFFPKEGFAVCNKMFGGGCGKMINHGKFWELTKPPSGVTAHDTIVRNHITMRCPRGNPEGYIYYIKSDSEWTYWYPKDLKSEDLTLPPYGLLTSFKFTL
jgi:hypothetical protein